MTPWIVPGSAAVLVVIALAFALVCVRRAEHAASIAQAAARNAKTYRDESRTQLHQVEGMAAVAGRVDKTTEHPSQPPATDVVPVIVQTSDPASVPNILRGAADAYLAQAADATGQINPDRLVTAVQQLASRPVSPSPDGETVADRTRREP